MNKLFEIHSDAREVLDNQLRLIKKGWHTFAPIAVVVFFLAIFKSYDPDRIFQQIVIAIFSMGVIYIFAFIINPLKRLAVLNRTIETLKVEDNKVLVTTYPALWKRPRAIEFENGRFELKKGANDKGVDLFGQHPSYRLVNYYTQIEYFLVAPFFTEWDMLEGILKERTVNEKF